MSLVDRLQFLLITSGGLGPTHDDVTLRAIATAFNTRLAESAELLTLLRSPPFL